MYNNIDDDTSDFDVSGLTKNRKIWIFSEHLPSNKYHTWKCGADKNSYYILLEAKAKCIWN